MEQETNTTNPVQESKTNENIVAPENNTPKTEDPNKQWDYFNMVNSTEPEKKKRTGTNQTPARKNIRKKHKARRVQCASRRANRKH